MKVTFAIVLGLTACAMDPALSGSQSKKKPACSMISIPGLDVEVSWPADGPVPTVTATDGSYQDTLVLWNDVGATGDRQFLGARDRPGEYTVSVSEGELGAVTLGPLVVTKDECYVHTVGAKVTFTQPVVN